MLRSFFLLLFLLPFLLPAGPFVRCGVEYFPPYFYNLKAKEPGFAVELIRNVLPKDQCRMEFVHAGWGGSLANIHKSWAWVRAYAGVAHGDVSARFTAVPLYRTRSAVFVRKGSAVKYKDVSSLLKGKTGLVKNYSHSDELDAYEKEHASDGRIVYGDTVSNLRTLRSGKIMFLIDNIDSVYAALKRLRWKRDEVLLLKKLDNETPFFLIFCWNKEFVPVVKTFNENLKKFMKTPAYRNLREKYGVEP